MKVYSRLTGIFIRIFVCILMAGFGLYLYIYEQNQLTALRLAIPSLAKEVRNIQEENSRLKYEIDQFETPIHLMELMRMPEFGHLKFAYNNEVMVLPKQPPLNGKSFIELQKGSTP